MNACMRDGGSTAEPKASTSTPVVGWRRRGRFFSNGDAITVSCFVLTTDYITKVCTPSVAPAPPRRI